MKRLNPQVDGFLRKTPWKAELTELRRILLKHPLVEEVKWRWPCYSFEGHNVVLMHGFKAFCALLFFKGALMKDAKGVLVRPGENTHAGRQMRFAGLSDVAAIEAMLDAYVEEAIALEKSGVKVERKPAADVSIPDELVKALKKTPALKKAFGTLTPGRQRQYILYFSSAKQAATRESRIAKHAPRILDGKGMDDE